MLSQKNPFFSKLNRSSTSFQIQLNEALKKITFSNEYSFLKYYQEVARQYIDNVDIDSRGILLYWTMGLGKSLGAIAIAVDQIKAGRPVIILSTASLQENMRKAVKQYINLRKIAEPDYHLGRLDEKDLNQ